MDKLWGVWELGDKIGQGSFGEVYKAHKTELGKTFYSAIKHISLPKTQDEIEDIIREGYVTTSKDVLNYYKDTIDDLVKEIEIMYELRANKNIVDYQDHLIVEKTNGETGFDIYIRMELLKSLDKYLEKNKVTEEMVIKLGIDIATALSVCNKHNLLHRDIKPANIFVDDDNTFKLGDFGVARRLEKTTYGMSKKGTYNYMSPEIYKGDKANIASDIYSLGIVMYRLLNNNRAPFIDKNVSTVKATEAENALVKRMSGEELPDIEGVDKKLMYIIKKASSFYQKDRYKDPKDLLNDLNKLKNGLEIEEELDKTVSVYDEALEKTVSVYSKNNKDNKKEYESDEELRERIRKIIAEEATAIDNKKSAKFISVKSFSQKMNKKRSLLSFFICLIILVLNILVAINLKNFIIFPHDIVLTGIRKTVLLSLVFTDIIVFFAFICSLISRKSQKVMSYGYLINSGILLITFLYLVFNHCRVSYLYYFFILCQILLFFINYKWRLTEVVIDVEEDEKEYYENKNNSLIKYYEKPYFTKVGIIIYILLFLGILGSVIVINSTKVKSQENGRNVNKRQLIIKNEYINIRKEANTSSAKLGVVYKDEVYTILNEVTKNKIKYYYIETEYGVKGYIADKDDWIFVYEE